MDLQLPDKAELKHLLATSYNITTIGTSERASVWPRRKKTQNILTLVNKTLHKAFFPGRMLTAVEKCLQFLHALYRRGQSLKAGHYICYFNGQSLPKKHRQTWKTAHVVRIKSHCICDAPRWAPKLCFPASLRRDVHTSSARMVKTRLYWLYPGSEVLGPRAHGASPGHPSSSSSAIVALSLFSCIPKQSLLCIKQTKLPLSFQQTVTPRYSRNWYANNSFLQNNIWCTQNTRCITNLLVDALLYVM